MSREDGLSAAPDLLHFRVDGKGRAEGGREQEALNGREVRFHPLGGVPILLQLLLDSL